LNAYGQYNFGSTSSATSDVRSLATDLSLAASTNSALASVLSLNDRTVAVSDTTLRGLQQPYTQPMSISQAEYDEASAAIQAVGGLSQSESVLAQQLTYGILSAALANGTSPREQMYNRKPPQTSGMPYTAGVSYQVGDLVSYNGNVYVCTAPIVASAQLDPNAFVIRPLTAPVNSWSSTNGTGLSLSNQTYGIINAQRGPSSQIGFNEHSTSPRPTIFPVPQTPVGGGLNADRLPAGTVKQPVTISPLLYR
jgi:hypothetical protein